MRYGQMWLILLVLLSMSFLTACGIPEAIAEAFEDPETRALAALDNAIVSLESGLGEVTTVLEGLRADLREMESDLARDVSTIIARATAETSIEFRCNADFLRRRVLEDLKRLKAKLTGGTGPMLKPVICRTIPSDGVNAADVLAGEVNTLGFAGYNFDIQNPVTVFLETDQRRTDISGYLDLQSHYWMTVNLARMHDLLNSQDLERIVIEWDANELSNIPIVPIRPRPCATKQEWFQPSPIDYRPPHTEGDADYHGNGPRMNAVVYLTINEARNRIGMGLYLHAIELGSGTRTTAEGTHKISEVYQAPRGYRIVGIVGNSRSAAQYTDVDHSIDPANPDGPGPVRLFEFYGDRDGNDAGVYTRMTVHFNKTYVDLVETGDCVN